ncbi:hypothetical protein CHUAL_009140 [Chamberlinius hualienensis]
MTNRLIFTITIICVLAITIKTSGGSYSNGFEDSQPIKERKPRSIKLCYHCGSCPTNYVYDINRRRCIKIPKYNNSRLPIGVRSFPPASEVRKLPIFLNLCDKDEFYDRNRRRCIKSRPLLNMATYK